MLKFRLLVTSVDHIFSQIISFRIKPPNRMTLNNNRLEVFKSIVNERSHWKWFDTDKSIPDDLLKDVMRTAQRAPSSFNTQPHKVVIVRDNESKLALAEGMIGDSNKNIVLTADTNAVFLADLEVLLNI